MNTSIKQTILEFFQESDGTGSSMRFIFIINTIWVNILITVLALTVFDKIGFAGIIAMYTSMNGVNGTLKIMQKTTENKPITDSSTDPINK